jgi:tRNA threonylcarbamoyladenosine biosynthesis protein TsaB
MRVLAVESSGTQGSVALVEDDRVIGETVFETGMVHGRDIAPSIQGLCPRMDVDLIAVDVGPGSYTGLRVGIAAAKGLCLALRKPAAGVVSLDVLADGRPGIVAAVLDAKWDQVYGALYENGTRTTEIFAEEPAVFARRVPRGAIVVGDGWRKHPAPFSGFATEEAWPRASVVARLALKAARVEGASLVPLYLRPTEAEVKLSRKQ